MVFLNSQCDSNVAHKCNTTSTEQQPSRVLTIPGDPVFFDIINVESMGGRGIMATNEGSDVVTPQYNIGFKVFANDIFALQPTVETQTLVGTSLLKTHS